MLVAAGILATLLHPNVSMCRGTAPTNLRVCVSVSTTLASLVDEDSQHVFCLCPPCRYLNTWLRKIPFKLPKPPTNDADARVVKAAERTATSVAILACCGDLERMAMAAFNESCSTCLSCRLAVCGGGMMAAQVPSSFAVVLLKSLAMDVTDKMLATLKLASPSKLPFWWWWGPNLDMLRTNRFTV